jgi:hypothetical protein
MVLICAVITLHRRRSGPWRFRLPLESYPASPEKLVFDQNAVAKEIGASPNSVDETQQAPYELVNKSKKLLRVAVLNGRGAVFRSGSDFNAVE